MTMNELVSKINAQMTLGIDFARAVSEQLPHDDFKAKGWRIRYGWSTEIDLTVCPVPGNPLYQQELYAQECKFARIKARRKKDSQGYFYYAYCEAQVRSTLSLDQDLVEIAEHCVCVSNQYGAEESVANLAERALRLDGALLRMHATDNVVTQLARDIEAIRMARNTIDNVGGCSSYYDRLTSTEGRAEVFPALAERINTFLSDHGQPQNERLTQLAKDLVAAHIEGLGVDGKLLQPSGDEVIVWTVEQIVVSRHGRAFDCSTVDGATRRFASEDVGTIVFLTEHEAAACPSASSWAGGQDD